MKQKKHYRDKKRFDLFLGTKMKTQPLYII